MKKVVLAIDSFKGCLTSAAAEAAAAQGIHAVFPACEVLCIPVADGGEGMLEILMTVTKGTRIAIRAHDPLMEIRDTHYAISRDGLTAFIEMAAISGLPLVSQEKRDPMLTTTFGTGELIVDALKHGCRNFIIGLGGSATNDAGLGMLQALGFRFFNTSGTELDCMACGKHLIEIASIDSSSVHPALKEAHFTAACDVRNPFTGTDGAAYIFAPQKGANQEMVIALDAGMQKFAEVIREHTGKDIASIPGSGAAGGMGGGLLAFLNAELKTGIQLLLDALHFSEKIKNADLVITGEGKSDRQTIMGKVPSGILKEAMKQQIPVVLLAGSIENTDELNHAGFQSVFSITPSPVSLQRAMEVGFAQENIRRTTEQICRLMQCRKQ